MRRGLTVLAMTAAGWTSQGLAATISLSLQDAITFARRNAPELIEFGAQKAHARAQIEGVDRIYDPTLAMESNFFRDRSESASVNSGEEIRGRKTRLAVQKMWGIGLSSELAYQREWQDIIFPEATPPTVDPVTGGVLDPGHDPSQFQRYNPAQIQSYELTLRQPLWRNVWGREVDLQRQVSRGLNVAPTYALKTQEQDIQAEAEQLYWAMLRLREQINLSKRLVKKSKRFRSLMSARTQIGRADNVDVATADAQVVSHEGRLLELELEHERVRQRLAYRINPRKPAPGLELTEKLASPASTLPVSTAEDAKKLALTKRFDLQQLRESQPSLRAEKELASEENKPQVDLFAQGAVTGTDQSSGEASSKATEGKHPKWVVGLSLKMDLGGTGPGSRRAQAEARLSEIDAKLSDAERRLNQQVDLAFHDLQASSKLRNQAEKSIRSLENQLAAERKKFKQARSEEIVALSYEMEVLSARNSRIIALYKARLAEAQIRHALHAYPSER